MGNKGYEITAENIDVLSGPQVAEPQVESLFRPETAVYNKDCIKVLSLFSGCGGMDIGLEGGFICHKKSVRNIHVDSYVNADWIKLKQTRLKTIFACDILPEARTAWVNYMRHRNNDASVYHLNSVVDLVNAHKNGAEVFPSDVDIVTGGFPCQDFSVSGKRKGFDTTVSHNGKKDPNITDSSLSRGKLYYWMKEVIEITKPKIFIAENVKGLVSLGDVKNIIQKDFSEAAGDGYYVFDPQILYAADFGVPETRERIIFIGVRKNALKDEVRRIFESGLPIPDSLNPYPQPSHSSTDSQNRLPYVTCKDVLDHLAEPELSDDMTHRFFSKAKFLENGGQGQTEIKYEGLGPTIRAEHHGNIEFRRLSKENGGKNDKELSLGLQQRRLTPRECALIQTFPPDYNFVLYKYNKVNFSVSPSMAYKIIGNAVPPMLAYNISLRIQELWPLYFNTSYE